MTDRKLLSVSPRILLSIIVLIITHSVAKSYPFDSFSNNFFF